MSFVFSVVVYFLFSILHTFSLLFLSRASDMSSLFAFVYVLLFGALVTQLNAQWFSDEDDQESGSGEPANASAILFYETFDEPKKVHRMSTSSLKTENILLQEADEMISEQITEEISNVDLQKLITGSLKITKVHNSDGSFETSLQKLQLSIVEHTIDLYNVLDSMRGERHAGMRDVRDIIIPLNATDVNAKISQAIELVIR